MKAVLLAAGLGTRLEPLTKELPKCMVPVDGVPLVDRMITRIVEVGIRDIIVVTGYMREKLELHLSESPGSIRFVHNERYADWGNFYSLLVAEEAIGGDDFIKFDADVLLDGGVLPALLEADGPGVLAIDRSETLAEEEMKARVDDTGRIEALNKQMDPATALGESIGIERIDAVLAPDVFAALRAMIDRGETHDYYERAYERLMETGHHFGWADISACTWTEVDDLADLERANKIAAGM